MSHPTGESPLLYVTIVRNGRGVATLELIDAESAQLLRIPESLAGIIVKAVPELHLAATALGNLAASSHSYTYVMTRPGSTARLLSQDFVTNLIARLPNTERRSIYREALTSREIEMQSQEALEWDHLKWCLELGLHQWTRIVHTSQWRCAVCGGRSELLLPKVEPFQRILKALLTADPWRSTSDRSYEHFERLRRDNPTSPEFRVVVDPLLLQDGDPPQESSAEGVILRLGPRINRYMLVTPLPQQDQLPGWVNVVKAETGHATDVEGEAHEHAYVTKGGRTQPIELGEVEDIDQLASRLNRNGRGQVLARTLLLGHKFGHATITTDSELLQLDDQLAHAVMTPRSAAVLLGTFARHTDHIPVGAYRITSDYFYEDRAFVLIPAISDFIQDAAAGVDEGEVNPRVLRLIWSNVERFGLLARAEDEIGFRLFFGQGGRRDVIYHFDYLLLLVRAVIEGLGEIAATVHGVIRPTRPESLSWKELRRNLKQARSPLATLIAPGTKAHAFSDLVSTLRNPLAHAERWESADSSLGATVWIGGNDAETVARSICRLESDPMGWGLSGMRMDKGELELSLDPYPFAVHLNMHLLSVTAAFLEALSDGAGWEARSRRQPWAMTNPQLDETAFGIIATMTWPLPETNWTA